MIEETPVTASGLFVGSYKRRMSISIERMYENALDWEHLPFLHGGSFSHIKLLESDGSGWRARVGVGPNTGEAADPKRDITLELRLDRARHRWISSTLEGPGKGSQIWTHAFEFGPRDIEINADFFIPGVSSQDKENIGAYYADLYRQLYDEDEPMMLERQRQLDARKNTRDTNHGEPIHLGILSEIETRLPLSFEMGGRTFQLVKDANELVAFARQCPHMLGPLEGATIIDGAVTCPWHDYTFDIRTGACRTGQQCKLPTAPTINVDRDTGQVTATRDLTG